MLPPLRSLLGAIPPLSAAVVVMGGLVPAAADEGEAQRCLALTLYWEARDEGRDGMIAVGHVVLNRLKSREFPANICAIVREGGESPPCQFAYWCDGKRDDPAEGEQWEMAQAAARELLSDPPPDPTGGALFFHSVDDAARWTKSRRRTATIGRHVYYR